MAKTTQQQPKKVLAHTSTQKPGEDNSHAFTIATTGETKTHSKSHMEMKRSDSQPQQGKHIRRPPKRKDRHSQPTWGNNSPFSTMKPRHTYTVDNGGVNRPSTIPEKNLHTDHNRRNNTHPSLNAKGRIGTPFLSVWGTTMENPNGVWGSRISSREDYQNNSRWRKTSTLLRESEPDPKSPKKWDRGRVEWVFSSATCDVKRKSPLVEWVHGKGLTVLPHPPLLSNNCSQTIEIKWVVDTWKTPNDPHGLDKPPLNLRNHALFIQRCTVVAICRFILIDVHIYMIPKL